MQTSKNALEPFDGILKGHQLAQVSSEDLGHLKGLGQESLDLTSTSYSQLILLRQLIHTQDSNNILQRLVILQRHASLMNNQVTTLGLQSETN